MFLYGILLIDIQLIFFGLYVAFTRYKRLSFLANNRLNLYELGISLVLTNLG
jgi:hypothetical protein